jgi:hypothetical protein
MLARMDVSREPRDFTRLLHGAGVGIPVHTHIEVITPVLADAQQAFLEEVRHNGNAVELFLLGGDTRAPRTSRTGSFPVFVVSDYGNELISH